MCAPDWNRPTAAEIVEALREVNAGLINVLYDISTLAASDSESVKKFAQEARKVLAEIACEAKAKADRLEAER